MSTPSLGPAARSLHKQLLEGNYVPPEPRTIEHDEILAAIRPEMYEIGAVIGSDAVAQMKERQIAGAPNFGLVTRQGYNPGVVKTFDDMHSALIDTVGYFVRDAYELPDTHRPAFERLTRLVAAAYHADPEAGNGRYKNGARGFIQAGLNTSTSTSLGAQVGIDALLKASVGEENATQARFREVAKRSMNRLILPLAMDNVDRMPAYRRAIFINFYDPDTKLRESDPFVYNPNMLHMVPDPNDPNAYVDFITPPEQLIDAQTGKRIGDLAVRFETLTCLGTVMFPGVEVATRTIWDWTTDIVAGIKYKDR